MNNLSKLYFNRTKDPYKVLKAVEKLEKLELLTEEEYALAADLLRTLSENDIYPSEAKTAFAIGKAIASGVFADII